MEWSVKHTYIYTTDVRQEKRHKSWRNSLVFLMILIYVRDSNDHYDRVRFKINRGNDDNDIPVFFLQ